MKMASWRWGKWKMGKPFPQKPPPTKSAGCLTLTMTINQAITRCKCNALNIFLPLTPLHNIFQSPFSILLPGFFFGFFVFFFVALGKTAVYLKIKFTPNLRRQLAAFFTQRPCQTFNFMNWIMPGSWTGVGRFGPCFPAAGKTVLNLNPSLELLELKPA